MVLRSISGKILIPNKAAAFREHEALEQIERMLLAAAACRVRRNPDEVTFDGSLVDFASRATVLLPIAAGGVEAARVGAALRLRYSIRPRLLPLAALTIVFGVLFVLAGAIQHHWVRAAFASLFNWAWIVFGTYAVIWWRFAHWLEHGVRRYFEWEIR
jgi:hypothetical protein